MNLKSRCFPASRLTPTYTSVTWGNINEQMKKRLFVSSEWNYPSVCVAWITGRWLGIYHVWHEEEESGVDLPYLNTKLNSDKMGFNFLTQNYVLETLETCLWSSPFHNNVITQGDDANQPLQTMQIQYFPKHFWAWPRSLSGMTQKDTLCFKTLFSGHWPA